MLNVTIDPYEEGNKIINVSLVVVIVLTIRYNVSTITTEDGYYGLYKKDKRKIE